MALSNPLLENCGSILHLHRSFDLNYLQERSLSFSILSNDIEREIAFTEDIFLIHSSVISWSSRAELNEDIFHLEASSLDIQLIVYFWTFCYLSV